MRKLILFLATGFYSGYAPFAPGTAGSVVGLLLAWGVTVPLERRSPLAALALIAGLFAVGCWLSERAEKLLDQHDSSHIVIDEIVGMALTMYLCPARAGSRSAPASPCSACSTSSSRSPPGLSIAGCEAASR